MAVVEPGLVSTELPSHISDPAVRTVAEQVYGEIRILDPEDVADAVLYAVTRPAHVAINEILVRPTAQVR